MITVDYLIVGQGLAGSCFALECIKRKNSFFIIDQPNINSASRVAAGLFNPITGKTMKPTWRANELFPFLLTFYREAESLLEQSFIHKMPIIRPFVSVDERAFWENRIEPFVQGIVEASGYSQFIHSNFGSLGVMNSGFLETEVFLSGVHDFCIKRNCLRETKFIFADFDPKAGVYKDVKFEKAIFCEGTAVEHNPFFHWLPIRKLKGEMLTVNINLPDDVIFNRGVFAIPTREKQVFKVGATYTHDPLPGNTVAGVQVLKEKMERLFAVEAKVVNKNWGHRPTTSDRRPILGRHPTHNKTFVFNGLGTKGVSLAPFFAVQLADHLAGVSELERTINIERFYSLSFQNQGD